MSIKVYGGRRFRAGQQHRAIVATTSQKKVAEIVGVSVGEIRDYWSVTANPAELKAALAEPGVLLIEITRGNFRRANA